MEGADKAEILLSYSVRLYYKYYRSASLSLSFTPAAFEERSGAEYICANGRNTFAIARRLVPFARRFICRAHFASISKRNVTDKSRLPYDTQDALNRSFRERIRRVSPIETHPSTQTQN